MGREHLAELPTRTEVAIVGGTVSAYVLATVLAESGAQVVVLDPAKTVGATGANQGVGHGYGGLPESAFRLVHAIGFDRAAALYRMSDEGLCFLADRGVLSRRTGFWSAANEKEEEELCVSAEHLRKMGQDAKVSHGVLSLPDEALVDPVSALNALAICAAKSGARILSHQPLMSFDDGVLQTATAQLIADVVIHAADAASSDWHPFFEPCLNTIRENAAIYPGLPMTGVERNQMGYFTVRETPLGGLVRGARWATMHMETGETDPVAVPKVQSKLDAFVEKRGASFLNAGHRWAWIETTTCDNLPLVGPLPGAPTLLTCSGFGASDWGLGAGAALALAESLLRTGQPATEGLAPTRMVL
ncbi:MAG: glycine/D-amino acid oxidase-like deaminating enzyme [Myxococcota bacterium]